MANYDIQPSSKFCATVPRTIRIQIGKDHWDLETLLEKLEKYFCFINFKFLKLQLCVGSNVPNRDSSK